LTKATARDPEAKEAWRLLGYAYKDKRRTGDAIKAFKKYLEVVKDDGNTKEIQLEINDLSKDR
jgi:hypothetical protein